MDVTAKSPAQWLDIHKLMRDFPIVQAIAQRSKDQSTKVGALIIGPDGEPRSYGWNGAPRGSKADEDERATQRPEKYFWMEHAERNAIYNAARVGTPLNGSSMLVTHPPCMDCARAIVQSGIKRVIWIAPTDQAFAERWAEHAERIAKLFNECGVEWAVV